MRRPIVEPDAALVQRVLQDDNWVNETIHGASRARIIKLYRQIRICDPHFPALLTDLELLYLKEVKKPEQKPFVE